MNKCFPAPKAPLQAFLATYAETLPRTWCECAECVPFQSLMDAPVQHSEIAPVSPQGFTVYAYDRPHARRVATAKAAQCGRVLESIKPMEH